MSGNPGNIVAGTTGGKGKGKDPNVHNANATEAAIGSTVPATRTYRRCYFNEFECDAIINQWKGRTILDPNRLPPISLTAAAGPAVDYRIDDWNNPYMQDVSYLEGYPSTEMAEYIMKWVSKVTIPLMKRYGWTVDHLSEFYPAEEGLLGTNYRAGRFIVVRLREPWNWNVFRDSREILSSVIHELCHNSYTEHNGDFYHLWNDLNYEMGFPGAAGGDAELHAQMYPRNPLPDGHIAISTGGQKILMTVAEWQKHFSAYVTKYTHQVGPIFHIERAFDPCVVVRLVQLAKGLDPADDKPLSQVLNCRSYWNDEFGFFGIMDGFSNASLDGDVALKLYLCMYRAGEEFGWHASSKKWVMEQLSHVLRWMAALDPGPWAIPQPTSPQGVTRSLAYAIRLTCRLVTARDKSLREVVMDVLRGIRQRIHGEDKKFAEAIGSCWLLYDYHETRDLFNFAKDALRGNRLPANSNTPATNNPTTNN